MGNSCQLWKKKTTMEFYTNTQTHTILYTHLSCCQRPVTSTGTTVNSSEFEPLPVHVQWEMFALPRKNKSELSTRRLCAALDRVHILHWAAPCQHTSYITRVTGLDLQVGNMSGSCWLLSVYVFRRYAEPLRPNVLRVVKNSSKTQSGMRIDHAVSKTTCQIRCYVLISAHSWVCLNNRNTLKNVPSSSAALSC